MCQLGDFRPLILPGSSIILAPKVRAPRGRVQLTGGAAHAAECQGRRGV